MPTNVASEDRCCRRGRRTRRSRCSATRKTPTPAPMYGTNASRCPSGRKRSVAVNGTIRRHRSCSISEPFAFTKVGVDARHRSRGRYRHPGRRRGSRPRPRATRRRRCGPLKSLEVESEKFEVVRRARRRSRRASSPVRHEATEVEVHRLLGGDGRGDQSIAVQRQRRRSP